MAEINDCGCRGCSLWLRLEAERLDTSYLRRERPVEPSKPVEVPKTRLPERKHVCKPLVDENRDRLFFNAGRYQAGDRDESAARAWNTMQKMFDKLD
jgi:hypothetical protein